MSDDIDLTELPDDLKELRKYSVYNQNTLKELHKELFALEKKEDAILEKSLIEEKIKVHQKYVYDIIKKRDKLETTLRLKQQKEANDRREEQRRHLKLPVLLEKIQSLEEGSKSVLEDIAVLKRQCDLDHNYELKLRVSGIERHFYGILEILKKIGATKLEP